MRYLTESELSNLAFNRIKNVRTKILAKINNLSGKWCCEFNCEWKPNEDYLKSKEKDEDYAYRDLVNKYYDIAKNNK